LIDPSAGVVGSDVALGDAAPLADILERIARIEAGIVEGEKALPTWHSVQEAVVHNFEFIVESSSVQVRAPRIGSPEYRGATWPAFVTSLHRYGCGLPDRVWRIVKDGLPGIRRFRASVV
jgi:hypothetical protein